MLRRSTGSLRPGTARPDHASAASTGSRAVLLRGVVAYGLAIGVVAEFGEPAAHPAVDGARAEGHCVRYGEVLGEEQERILLRSSHAAVRADELLERRNLLEVAPVGRVDHDVRHVWEAVRPLGLGGRV